MFHDNDTQLFVSVGWIHSIHCTYLSTHMDMYPYMLHIRCICILHTFKYHIYILVYFHSFFNMGMDEYNIRLITNLIICIYEM